MRTVRVTSEFVDKNDLTRLYKPGEVVSFDDDRVDDMVRRGLAEIVDEERKRQKRENKDNSESKGE